MVIKFEVREQEVWIDDVDADLTEKAWYLAKYRGNYVTTTAYNPETQVSLPVPMHRIIMSRMLGRLLERGECVDHIDRNLFNNQRSNLRVATRAQNAANQLKHRDNSTGYKGVARNGKRFMAHIQVNKQAMYLGTYDTPQEAHAAYIEAAKKYHGEFARWE